jgi:polyisoprenoid-binding protein YceI
VVAVCATGVAIAAHAAMARVETPAVEFLATATAGLKVHGESPDLSASEANGALTLTAAIAGLKTGIGLRDTHLKKYLEAEKYPSATLVVDRSTLKIPDDNATVAAEATGQLTIHGVTRPTTFQYEAKRTGSDYLVQGKLHVSLPDFKIEQPCFLGVCVENQIKVKAKLRLRDQ